MEIPSHENGYAFNLFFGDSTDSQAKSKKQKDAFGDDEDNLSDYVGYAELVFLLNTDSQDDQPPMTEKANEWRYLVGLRNTASIPN